jgi:predicted outer membrane repeat protein
MFTLDMILEVSAGPATIVSAMSRSDCADYGWDPTLSQDPLGVPGQSVEIAGANFNGNWGPVVGYYVVRSDGNGDVLLELLAGEIFGGSIDYYFDWPNIQGQIVVHQGQRWNLFVDANASGANDGSSWTDAYTHLQDALLDTNSNPDHNHICVAQGTYTPDSTSADPNGSGDRYATFQLINGITLKGGYAGFGAPNPYARDIGLYETILSGDLNENDVGDANRGENSYHVVTGTGTDATAVLDGFTISRGNANGPFNPHVYGAGMYNDAGDPTVTNCTFSGNSAESYGGGMYNLNASPELANCTFSSNSAQQGGGLYARNSSPTVTNCMFTGNSAVNTGGGMRNYANSSPTLTNCTFSDNSAVDYGGGMSNGHNTTPDVINCQFIGNFAISAGGMFNDAATDANITGCLFSGNTAENYGGGIYNSETGNSPRIINCTLIGNSAGSEGGGMYNYQSGSPTVTNCILWGNTAPSGPQIYNDGASSAACTYSNVQGAYSGTGNIDVDPCFADPCNGDFRLKSEGGRWDPNSETWVLDDVTSPCIDAGDWRSPICDEPYPNGGKINMGAYGGTAEAGKSPLITCWEPLECPGQRFGDALCDGDIGAVNLGDLYALKAHFGQSAPWVADQCCADFNHDGAISLGDFFILKANFGSGPYSPSTGNQQCRP